MNAVINGDTAWMLISTALVFLMTPGLALFYGGMVKRKNVLNAILSSFFLAGLASLLWVIIGYSLSFGKDVGGIIGNLQWFGLTSVGGQPNPDYAPTIPHLLFAAYQMMFAIITPALITGALVERVKFSSLIVFTTLWSIIVYYPLAHMLWGTGGILKTIGALDFAGGNVVHVSSGISALVACIILGKRRGYGSLVHQPHNVPLVFIGASLLWFGWFGFNAGSALSSGELAVHAFVTTNTSAAAGLVAWMVVEKIKTNKVTLLGVSTGAVVGLASITQGSGFIPIWAAIVVGAVASPLCYFAMTVIKTKFGYDDTLDAFGCHGVGGIWGAIATGLFAHSSVNPAVIHNGLVFGDTQLFSAQIISLLVTIVLGAAGTLVISLFIKHTMKFRVEPKYEAEGLDTTLHGESAYPSFIGMD